MAEFLDTKGVAHHLKSIIEDAKNELVLISPYIQLPSDLLHILKAQNNISVKIVYGKKDLQPKEMQNIQRLDVALYYSENLHAKCYYNERKVLISSMNLYDYSEKNNLEMGVLIDKETDPETYKKSVDFANYILSQAKLIHAKIKYGSCIRCGKKIPLNIEKPYCKQCFDVWQQFGNPEYNEKVCHCCGKKYRATLLEPECQKCSGDFVKINYKKSYRNALRT